MFAVLKTEPYCGGIIRKIRSAAGEYPKITYCAVVGAAPYALINVLEKAGGVDWEEVRKCVGQCSDRIILPPGKEIPIGFGLSKYKPKLLPLIMTYNSFIYIMKRSGGKMAEEVALFDRRGYLAEKAYELPEYAKKIKVFTDNYSAYEIYGERIMREYGVSLSLKPYINKEECRGTVIADEYNEEKMKNAKAVFCPERGQTYENMIYGRGIVPAGDYLKSKPEEISDCEFVSALYEFNNLRPKPPVMYEKLYQNSTLLTTLSPLE